MEKLVLLASSILHESLLYYKDYFRTGILFDKNQV